MRKTKPSCDRETAYPRTYPFVIYIIRNNQSKYSSQLSHNAHLWPYYLFVILVM